LSRLGPLWERENGVDEEEEEEMFQVKYNKRKEREGEGPRESRVPPSPPVALAGAVAN
jgi:hypothetical protein